jgi:hypothetical protein
MPGWPPSAPGPRAGRRDLVVLVLAALPVISAYVAYLLVFA